MNIHRDKDGSTLSCVSVMECDNYMYLAGVKVRQKEGQMLLGMW